MFLLPSGTYFLDVLRNNGVSKVYKVFRSKTVGKKYFSQTCR